VSEREREVLPPSLNGNFCKKFSSGIETNKSERREREREREAKQVEEVEKKNSFYSEWRSF
jgi:hypothetical protein